jgi:GNAT superfamily N-acetyltransferase
MNIRNATYNDAPSIRQLLSSLSYQATVSKLILMIETTFSEKDHQLLVAASGYDAHGFVALHFVPQLGVDGDLVLVSYFLVEENAHRKGIGKKLEEEIVALAKKRFCNRIDLHCSLHHEAANLFYKDWGYIEYPTYFCKPLIKMKI